MDEVFGTHRAADELVRLLAQQGQVDDALQVLRAFANSSSSTAVISLATLLAEHGQTEELQREVAAGTPGAFEALRSARSHETNIL